MEVFAVFDILDLNGNKVAEGHKASFCLEDNQCISGVEPKYACANYGDQGSLNSHFNTYIHTLLLIFFVKYLKESPSIALIYIGIISIANGLIYLD